MQYWNKGGLERGMQKQLILTIITLKHSGIKALRYGKKTRSG